MQIKDYIPKQWPWMLGAFGVLIALLIIAKTLGSAPALPDEELKRRVRKIDSQLHKVNDLIYEHDVSAAQELAMEIKVSWQELRKTQSSTKLQQIMSCSISKTQKRVDDMLERVSSLTRAKQEIRSDTTKKTTTKLW